MKFSTRVRLKRCNDRGEFELDWAKNKNNIAENSVALGYDTHNKGLLFHLNSNAFPRNLPSLCLGFCHLSPVAISGGKGYISVYKPKTQQQGTRSSPQC